MSPEASVQLLSSDGSSGLAYLPRTPWCLHHLLINHCEMTGKSLIQATTPSRNTMNNRRVKLNIRLQYTFVVLTLPAQQLRVGEDLLQSAEVADAKGKDGLRWVTSKMPGYTRRERQHHLSCDLHHTSAVDKENSD